MITRAIVLSFLLAPLLQPQRLPGGPPKYEVIVRSEQLKSTRYGGAFVADVVTEANVNEDLLVIARQVTNGKRVHCPPMALPGTVRFASSRISNVRCSRPAQMEV
jgi:hypothetical protein